MNTSMHIDLKALPSLTSMYNSGELKEKIEIALAS